MPLTSAAHITFARVEEPDEKRTPLFFVAFDLLSLDGKSTLEIPLRERRRRLEKLSNQWPRAVRLCPAVVGNLDRLMSQVRQLGLEAVVAKRLNSIYRPGERPGTWIKQKIQQSDDFVVGGYIPGSHGFEELLVGR